MGNKTYKDYSIKEYYDIYTKCHLRLVELNSYINGRPKLIENKSNALQLGDVAD